MEYGKAILAVYLFVGILACMASLRAVPKELGIPWYAHVLAGALWPVGAVSLVLEAVKGIVRACIHV